MAEKLKLALVLAHPDDETFGVGGTLAKYAAEGVETHLVTATRGERGWPGPEADYPGPEALGRIREAELRCAAAVLGVRQVDVLGYVDGELDRADLLEVIARLVERLRRVRPRVAVTFGPEGIYGHPDHIAISQLTTAAVVRAADPGYRSRGLAPHCVSKLYYVVATARELAAYDSVFGAPMMCVDGVERSGVAWPDWAITTRIDTGAYWETAWQALLCHRSQVSSYQKLAELPPERRRALWESQTYYRAYSVVNGGRAPESDLFAGLR